MPSAKRSIEPGEEEEEINLSSLLPPVDGTTAPTPANDHLADPSNTPTNRRLHIVSDPSGLASVTADGRGLEIDIPLDDDDDEATGAKPLSNLQPPIISPSGQATGKKAKKNGRINRGYSNPDPEPQTKSAPTSSTPPMADAVPIDKPFEEISPDEPDPPKTTRPPSAGGEDEQASEETDNKGDKTRSPAKSDNLEPGAGTESTEAAAEDSRSLQPPQLTPEQQAAAGGGGSPPLNAAQDNLGASAAPPLVDDENAAAADVDQSKQQKKNNGGPSDTGELARSAQSAATGGVTNAITEGLKTGGRLRATSNRTGFKGSSFAIILLLSIAKDFLDIVTVGLFGTIINIFISVILFSFFFLRSSLFSRIFIRIFVWPIIIEFIPFGNIFPSYTLAALLLRSKMNKKKKALDRAIAANDSQVSQLQNQLRGSVAPATTERAGNNATTPKK